MLLGQAAALLPVLIQLLQQAEMRIGRGLFRLNGPLIRPRGGRTLWDRDEGFRCKRP